MDPPALTLGNGAPLPSPPSISNVSAHSIVEPPPVYLIRSEHPQIHLSWASHFPQKVDKLKLRKDIKFFPVKITLKADYSTATREFEYGCSAKDTILGGRITLNLPDQRLDYCKKLSMPNGARVALTASCTYMDRQFKPDFGVQLEFGGETNTPVGTSQAVLVGNTFDVQQRIKLFKGLGVEVCGSLKLPTPAARYSAHAGTLALGEGAFHLHVAEINAIVRV